MIKKTFFKITDKLFGKSQIYQKSKVDYYSRVYLFSILGITVNIAFFILNTIYSAKYTSLWYGAFAAYYFLLTIQKLLVFIIYHHIWNKYKDDKQKLDKEECKIYIANGIWFIPIAITLAVIESFMITTNTPTEKSMVMAIASAAYAFYKITVAIINLVKAKKSNNKIIQTIRNIGLVDAFTSMLVLEVCMIPTFGTMDYDMLILVGASSVVVFLLTIIISFVMILSGFKKLHKI